MRLWLWKFMECFKMIQFSIFSTHFALIAGRKSLACGLISLSSLHRECLVFPFLWGPVQYIDTEWALRNWSWQTFTVHLVSDARLKCFAFLDILQEGEYPVPGSGDLPTCFLWQTAEIGLHQLFWEHIVLGLFWCSFGAVFRSQLCATSEQRQICDRASESQMKQDARQGQLKSHVRKKYHLVRLRQMSCKPYMRNPEWQLPEAKNKDVLKDVFQDAAKSVEMMWVLMWFHVRCARMVSSPFPVAMALWVWSWASGFCVPPGDPTAGKTGATFETRSMFRRGSEAGRQEIQHQISVQAKHWMDEWSLEVFFFCGRCVTRSPAQRSMKISDQNMPNWKDSTIFLGTWEFPLQWCVFRQELESLAQSLGIHVEQAKCDVSKQVPHQNMKTWLCMS